MPCPSRGHAPFPAGAIVRCEWPGCGILWGANRQFSNDRRIHNVATLIMPVIRNFMCYNDPRSGAHQVRSQAHIVGQEVYGVGFVEWEYGKELGSSDCDDLRPSTLHQPCQRNAPIDVSDLLEYFLQSWPPIWWNYSLANAWSNNLNLKTVLKLCAYVQLESQCRACSIRTTRSTNLKLKKRDTKVTVRVSGIQVSIAEQITTSRNFA